MDVLLPVTREDLEPAPGIGGKYPRNRQIMLRFLEGQDIGEIAAGEDLGVETIRGILNSPLVQQEMQAITGAQNEKLRDRIARLGDEALDTLRGVMRGKVRVPVLNTNEILVATEHRMNAAKAILDRHPELDKKPSGADEAAQDHAWSGACRSQIGRPPL